MFSELIFSSNEVLDGSELECSLSSVSAEDELSPSFRLPLDFLGGVLAFGFFFLSSSNCESIYLTVSIDSYWARIISSYSLWTWACCSKRLAISSGVPAIYTKAFSLRKSSRPMIPRWQSVTLLLQYSGPGHCSPLGLLRQFECGYVSTLLPARCQTRQS